MVNANSTSSRTSKRNAGPVETGLASTPAEELVEALKLPPLRPRFDPKLMSGHSEELGRAGELLSRAYTTASVVSTLASIVRRNQIARGLDEECFTLVEEDHLLSAVEMLSDELSKSLCRAADHFDNELGGA